MKTQPAPNLRFRTYSIKNDLPLCTNIYLHPLAFAQSPTPGAATLHLDREHPIARTLRKLELSSRPLLYQYSPKNELALFGPRNLMDD